LLPASLITPLVTSPVNWSFWLKTIQDPSLPLSLHNSIDQIQFILSITKWLLMPLSARRIYSALPFLIQLDCLEPQRGQRVIFWGTSQYSWGIFNGMLLVVANGEC